MGANRWRCIGMPAEAGTELVVGRHAEITIFNLITVALLSVLRDEVVWHLRPRTVFNVFEIGRCCSIPAHNFYASGLRES